MPGVAEFVHLHVHTEYSLLDGMIRIPDLIERAEAFQMPAAAITDHGNIFGAVHFYERCKEKGIKPVIGCEVYVAPGKCTERDAVGHHLVLLCKNQEGYKNLCKLVTSSYLEGFYYKPRIDKEILEEHNQGLIALSGCLKGEIPGALLEEDYERANQLAGWFGEVFEDRFYLELQENGIPDQTRVNRDLIALGKKLGIKVVATNDCHYLTKDMARAHQVLLCIQTGTVISDEKRMKMSTDQFYFRSPGEMKENFAEVPEAISNTIEVASRCNLDWDLESKHYPRFPTPEGMTLEEALKDQAEKGFENRIPEMKKSDPEFEKKEQEYRQRFDHEIEVITRMGYSGYFLIVADFVNFAKGRGIPVGPGRGSAAGSLVSYCLGITDINPLPYGLIFERFLNPERKGLPDIDVDLCQERRREVLKYVADEYGDVAQIITFGSMKARAAVRDVGRVLEFPYGEVDRIAKMIPEMMTLEEAYKQEPRFKEMRENDHRTHELLSLAEDLEGIARHASTHAAGVVISDKPLVNYLPLYKDQKSDEVVVQYDMNCVEKIGLIKFDLLGLKTLTLIKHCLDSVKDNRGVDLDMKNIDMDDEQTFELLGKGDTNGVFQLESSGMKDLLTRLLPNRFEELIAVVALYRPGPIGAGYVEKFIERKHGREEVEYMFPGVEEVLKETYGVLVYQEQVMEIAVRLAGYAMGEADNLRKAMGKKIPELMEAQKEKFMTGAQKNKIEQEKARKIFDDMAQFAHYGFNKSHAAVYAYVAFQTAYLKAHYPVEFMASLLTMGISDTDKIVRYLGECDNKGIPVDPPHVNTSEWRFKPEGERIRFGLGAVKGIGRAAVEAIQEAREQGPYSSLYDFCERVDLRRVNKRAVESLIKCGGFDGLGVERPPMMAAMEQAMEKGHLAAREREAGQGNLFEIMGEDGAGFTEEEYPEASWSSTELLSYEKEALGFYLTGHPLARYEHTMKTYNIVDTGKIPFMANGQEVLAGGIVTNKKETYTKKRGKKERMAFITLTDLKGEIEVVVFASVFKEARKHLESEELPVVVRGRVEANEDKTKILAGEIFPLEQAPEKLSLTMHLTVKRPMVTAEQVEVLGNLLKSNKGKIRVVVHVLIPERSETMISLPMEFWTSGDRELIRSLEELLGEESVRLSA